ncbi:MAG: major capsid protein [Desulfovibrio sp.]|nr:major capsid protein [Desulfovibrio sp.]
MSMLNFTPFTATEMTDAVNMLPLAPMRFSGMFESKGVRTTEVAVELKYGRITLIADSERGAPPEHLGGRGQKREVKVLSCSHLAQADTLSPEDLQNVRAFGSTELVSPASVVNDKMAVLKRNLLMTKEFHRLGAVKGIVLDADGRTVLHDLFETFGVRQIKSQVTFPATAADNANPILTAIVDAKRKAEAAMQGNPYSHFEAIMGSNFYDMLTSHALVRKYFEDWLARRQDFGDNDYRRRGFTYGSVTFYEASEVVGGLKLVDDNKAHLYPVGPGIWKMYYAPADWMETVNTVGLPYYARMDEKSKGRGYDLEVQANPLTLCIYPEALVELTAKAG